MFYQPEPWNQNKILLIFREIFEFLAFLLFERRYLEIQLQISYSDIFKVGNRLHFYPELNVTFGLPFRTKNNDDIRVN